MNSRDSKKEENDIRVSVIIPTLNASMFLPELLKCLRNQTHPPHEVIVVDSSSEDDTQSISESFNTQFLSVHRQQFDHGGTRNYAARHASGDVLVFLTQDALPETNMFLETLIQPLEDDSVAAVYGRQIVRPDASPLERMTREFNYPSQPIRKSFENIEEYGIKTFFFTNVCSAVRKNHFQAVEGFPEPIILNEDMIIAAKCILAGYCVVYNPAASVIHSHDYSLCKQFQRNFDIGVSLRMNEWIFKYGKAEREGGKLIKQQLWLLWRKKQWHWIPRWFAEAIARYSGYRLGLSYNIIPVHIREKCSMHSGFWQRYEKNTTTLKKVEM